MIGVRENFTGKKGSDPIPAIPAKLRYLPRNGLELLPSSANWQKNQ